MQKFIEQECFTMKKLLAFGVAALLVFTLAGCGAPENRILEDDLETVLEDIYDYDGLSEDAQSFVSGLAVEEVSADEAEFHLGKDGLDFDRAIASVPSLGTSPFELTLVRTERGQDVEALKNEINDSIDPWKWVSFGVEDENVVVDNIGDVVVIIMSDNYAHELHEAFLDLEPEDPQD